VRACALARACVLTTTAWSPACRHFLVYAGQRWYEDGEGGGGSSGGGGADHELETALGGIAAGNLSLCPDVWVKEVASEVASTHLPAPSTVLCSRALVDAGDRGRAVDSL
jgi:hypothetical protein